MILVAHSAQDPYNKPLLDALGSIARPSPLPHGDVNFFGVWDANRAVRVLVERKRVLEFIQCVHTGRHLRQAQDGHSAGFDFQWLIVEGAFIPEADTGLVMVEWRGSWRRLGDITPPTGHIPDMEYSRLDSYLNQLDLYAGIRYRLSRTVTETAEQVLGLYRLFQQPPDEHNTMRGLYQQAMLPQPEQGASYLIPPSTLERVVMQLPGIGWAKGKALARQMGTLGNLCRAIADDDVAALREAEGIGKGLADGIIKAAQEE